MASSEKYIAGGCLCGKVRYTINYRADGGILARDPHTCQCTQCRKHCGSLMANFIAVHPSQVSPSQSSEGHGPTNEPSNPLAPLRPPFKEFPSSETGRRGFCSNCGSTISFRDTSITEELELFVGTVDENYLIGDRTERVHSDELAQKGGWKQVVEEEKVIDKKKKQKGEITGWELTTGGRGGHFFMRNAIAGVTDVVEGKKWVESTDQKWSWDGQ